MSSKKAHDNGRIDPDADRSDIEPNLEKVREILFGTQSRDLDKKLDDLEESFRRHVTQTKEDMAKRLTQLERYVEEEIATLAKRIDQEAKERDDALEAETTARNRSAKKAEQRIQQLQESLESGHQRIRKEILSQASTAQDDIEKLAERITAEVNRSVRDLRQSKVDRAGLAVMLSELAMRLGDEEEQN